jgi:hypothetical protein
MTFDPAASPDLAVLQSRLRELESKEAARQAADATAEARRMIERGQTDAVLHAHKVQLAQAQDRAKKFAIGSALDQAIASQNLKPGTAGQVRALLADQLVADETSSGYSVRTQDFRDVQSYVSQTMASPNYAHFLASGTPQAASNPGTPPAPAGAPEAPRNVGEAICMQAAHDRAQQKAAQPNPAAQGGSMVYNGRVVPMPSPAFGIRPQR